MTITKGEIFSVCFGCIGANFFYQYFNDRLWNVAFERSYFQCSAIFSLIFMNWFWKFLDNKKFHK